MSPAKLLFYSFLFGVNASFGQQPELLLPFGHARQVTNIVYNKDGKYIATTAEDNTVIIWDVYTGKSIHQLKGHVNKVNSITFSNDGNYIVTGSDDKLVSVWNARSGKLLYSLTPQQTPVSLVKFSPDSKYILICCVSGETFLWDILGEKPAWILDQGLTVSKKTNNTDFDIFGKDVIRAAAFSPKGKFVYTQNNEGVLKLFNVETGDSVYTGTTTKPNPLLLLFQVMARFTPDEQHLLVIENSNCRLLNLDNRTSSVYANKYGPGIINFDFFSGGDSVLAVHQFGRIIKWATGAAPVVTVADPQQPIFYYQAEFCLSQQLIITAAGDSTISCWDMSTGALLSKKTAGSVLNLAISPTGLFFAVNELYKNVKIHELPGGRDFTVLKAHNNFINAAVIDNDHHNILTSTHDGTIKIWNFLTGKITKLITGIDKPDCLVKLSNDNKYFYTWYSNKVKVFDAQSGELQHELGGGEAYNRVDATFDIITGVEISPDEKLIAAASTDESIKIWELATGKKLAALKADKMSVAYLKFSPDSKFIVGMSSLGRISTWDLRTKKIVDSVFTLPLGVGFFMSYNSGKICAESKEGNPFVYDIVQKKIIARFNMQGKSDFYSASFSVDDRFVITNGEFQSTIWDITSSKRIATITQDEYSVVKGVIADNNKEVFVVTSDGTIHIYDLPGGNETGFFNLGSNAIPDLEQTTDNKILAKNASSVLFYNIKEDKIIAFTPVDKRDYVVRADSVWFMSSPDAVRWLSWKADDKVYDFDQWDLQYNRPDMILKALGNTDTLLVGAYKNAWLKRIRKMKVDTTRFQPGFQVPESFILNRNEIQGATDKSMAQLNLRCLESGKENRVKKIFIQVNGNPLYGAAGLEIAGNVNDTSFSVSLELSEGSNVIKFSCLNDRGAESLQEIVYISYKATLPKTPATYFIGIGVSRYKDSTNDLRYADKDVRDIATVLQKKYPGIAITLLTNEKATKENIKAVKEFLLKSRPDDKIIVSFSGHGMVDKNFDFYYGTYDIDFNDPSGRGLSYDDIEWLLDGVPARNKLILMDACHSGELDKESKYTLDSNRTDKNVKEIRGLKITSSDSTRPGLKNTFDIMQGLFANIGKGNGSTIISAAAGTEFAYEGNNWANGVFTYTILQGLVENKADLDMDGQITVAELQEYVSDQVEQLTQGRQKPTSRQTNFDNNWQLW